MRFLLPALLLLPWLSGCDLPSEKRDRYVRLELGTRQELPLAPHVTQINARPSEVMMEEEQGRPLRFRILSKRTLEIREWEVKVGEVLEAPWGGRLQVHAFVPDLLILEKQAVHGPEGHVNPAVWVAVTDQRGEMLHESWLFSRDPAQTAWDHPRYDLTFLGPVSAGSDGGE